MSQQDLQPLRQLLRRLGDELRAAEPPAALRGRVLAACDAAVHAAPSAVAVVAGMPLVSAHATAGHPTRRLPAWPLAGVGAIAAAMLALVFVSAVFWSAGEPGARAPTAGGSAFVSLVPEERLRQLAREPFDQGPPWVVATELPRERLAAFGLPFDPARAGESVRAELLMHPAGEVLAVRIVH